MNFFKKNFNETIKLQKLLTEYRDVSRTPTTSKAEVFPTLVHSQKTLTNDVTKSSIPDVVRVLEDLDFSSI